jgi:hypothetical protein
MAAPKNAIFIYTKVSIMPNPSNGKESNNFRNVNAGASITHYCVEQLGLSYVLQYDCCRLVFPRHSE